MFEKVRAVAGFGKIPIPFHFVVKGLAIILPFGGSADDLSSLVWQRDRLQMRSGSEIFGCEVGGRMLLEFFNGIEAAGDEVGPGDERQRFVGESDHRDEEFFRAEKLLGAGANVAAALDGARNLREVHDAKMELGMALGVVGEGAGDGLGTGHAEVVKDVAAGGVGEIGVDDAAGEVGAVVGGAVEMVVVGRVVHLVDELAILFNGSVYDENVHAADESGGDHFAPFGLAAGLARRGVAKTGEIVLAVALFESVLDFVGSENGTIGGIFDAVEIDVERNDVPVEGAVFADVDIGADDGAGFAGGAEAEFGGRFSADVGEVDGHVTGAGDAVHAFAEGFVEDDADVGEGAGSGKVDRNSQEENWQEGRRNGLGRRGAASGQATLVGDMGRQTTPLGDDASGPL